MKTAPPPATAVIYARISSDPEGRELGVERQEADCRELAARLGVEVLGVYRENDTGASTRSRKARPKYDALMERVRGGGVGVILAYSNSRLSRRPREWDDVITFAEETGVQVRTVASGSFDYSTADGRATARTIAAWDAAEAERTSERVRRSFDQRAEQGKPHGPVPFGWTRVEGVDRLDPEQAEVVRELARRVLAREPIRKVTKDLNSRGVPSPRGAEWASITVRQVLLRERNAGRRVHRGAIIGRGAWEPILDEDTHDRVVALLRDPARVTPRGTPTRHLLSGIARCGRCGGVIRSNRVTDRIVSYVCADCHRVRRRLDLVDGVVEATIVERLSEPDGPDLLGGDQAALDAALSHAGALRDRLSLAADQFADGLIDAAQLARISARLRPQIVDAERTAEAARPADPELRALLDGDVERNWAAAPVEVRREVVRMLLRVTIDPVGAGGRFDPAGIRREWVSSAA